MKKLLFAVLAAAGLTAGAKAERAGEKSADAPSASRNASSPCSAFPRK